MNSDLDQDIFSDLDSIIDELKFVDGCAPLVDNHVFKRYRSNNITVAAVGAVSQGKSTLIDAMLGVDVLPHSQGEFTSVLTEVRKGAMDCAEVVDIKGDISPLSFDRTSIEKAIGGWINESGEWVKPDHQRVIVKLSNWSLPENMWIVDVPGLDKEGGRKIRDQLAFLADILLFVWKIEWDPQAVNTDAGMDPGFQERELSMLRDILQSKNKANIIVIANGFSPPLEAGREAIDHEWAKFRDVNFPEIERRISSSIGIKGITILPTFAHAALAFEDNEADFGITAIRESITNHIAVRENRLDLLRAEEIKSTLITVRETLSEKLSERQVWEASKANYKTLKNDRKMYLEKTRETIKIEINELLVKNTKGKCKRMYDRIVKSINEQNSLPTSNQISSWLDKHILTISHTLANELAQLPQKIESDLNTRSFTYSEASDIIKPSNVVVSVPNSGGNLRLELKTRIRTAVWEVLEFWKKQEPILQSKFESLIIQEWCEPDPIPAPSVSSESHYIQSISSRVDKTLNSIEKHLVDTSH